MTIRLESYLQQWEFSHPEQIAQTATSYVYKVQYHGETVVLKLLTPVGITDESRGGIALSYFNSNGAVRLLNASPDAHLLEYIDGADLVEKVTQGDDDQATQIIADVLKQLHTVACPDEQSKLVPLKRWFQALFDGKDNHPIFQRGALVADELLNAPLDCYVLHGDIHHGNIRHHSQRGWLAFDPKGLVGERTFDTANTLCNPNYEIAVNEERLLRTAHILADKTEIDYQRVLAFGFAYACLSACWSLEDGDNPSLALGVAEIINRHL